MNDWASLKPRLCCGTLWWFEWKFLPQAQMFEYLIRNWWCCLRRFRRWAWGYYLGTIGHCQEYWLITHGPRRNTLRLEDSGFLPLLHSSPSSTMIFFSTVSADTSWQRLQIYNGQLQKQAFISVKLCPVWSNTYLLFYLVLDLNHTIFWRIYSEYITFLLIT